MADIDGGHPTREAAFAVDSHNRVIYWDQGAAGLLGFDQSQTLNRHLGEVLSVWDESGNRYPVGNESMHEMARRGEDIRGFAIEVACADGSPVRVFSSVEVVRPAKNGSYQLYFRLRPDRRRQTAAVSLQQMVRQAVSEFSRSIGTETLSQREPKSNPSLSERQIEVIRLLSQGMQCDDIADRLNLSVCTVRRHVQNALERLDAHTQAEAVAKSIRLGLV